MTLFPTRLLHNHEDHCTNTCHALFFPHGLGAAFVLNLHMGWIWISCCSSTVPVGGQHMFHLRISSSCAHSASRPQVPVHGHLAHPPFGTTMSSGSAAKAWHPQPFHIDPGRCSPWWSRARQGLASQTHLRPLDDNNFLGQQSSVERSSAVIDTSHLQFERFLLTQTEFRSRTPATCQLCLP